MNDQINLEERYRIDVLADEAGGYFALPSKDELDYTDLLFDVCEQFGIRYYSATPKERYFVEEVTRVTWALRHGAQVGEAVRPSFCA